MPVANGGLYQTAVLHGEPHLLVKAFRYFFQSQVIFVRFIANVEVAEVRRKRQLRRMLRFLARIVCYGDASLAKSQELLYYKVSLFFLLMLLLRRIQIHKPFKVKAFEST